MSDDRKRTYKALRAAAEAQLSKTLRQEIAHARPASRPSADQVTHELQVHQIELEMQNEALRKSQIALEESRDRYVDLYEFAPVGYLTLSPQGLIAQINLTGVTLLGRERSKLLHRGFGSLVVAADLDRWTRHLIGLRVKGGSASIELHLLRPDGSSFAALLDCMMPLDLGLRVALNDISASKQAEEKLRIASSVFTHAREGVLITDPDARIIDVNDAFSRITGYSREEVLGKNPRLLNSGRQDKAFYLDMWQGLTGKGHWYGEMWNRRKNGEMYVEWLNISAVRDKAGKTLQYVGLISDITALKEHQRQLEHIAHYDALTSLPNRVLLADRMHQGMANAQRRGQLLAVVYLDLDGFKAINDANGHEIGDLLLVALAERMKSALREGDTLARMGGDEFVAVLGDLTATTDSVPTLTRLLAATAQPVMVGKFLLQVSASLGVTFYPQDEATDADHLLRQADQAMYQAKQSGKNRYHVFDAAQDRSVRGHHESLDRIRQALLRQEFVLHYQPKVNMRSGAVIGAEALIRWRHPEKGLLSPAVFLPTIEDHPLAIDVGDWVIETALTQIGDWQAIGLNLPVSVNLGARQLQQSNFVQRLRAQLAAHPAVEPSSLELEVLETSALEDLNQISQVIEACRQIGVRFALDDFGTGYSSLTYLKRLAVAQLKIDQSFVREMLDDPDNLAILEGVIGLANAFRREIIAEGVETIEHGELLLQLGCDRAQGYGIAHPMPAAEIPEWAAHWRPDPRWTALRAVSRDDIPLLFAGVEHRAWLSALEQHIRGHRESPPPLDAQLCRFGIWLDSGHLGRRVSAVVHAEVATQHAKVHLLATELCRLHDAGKSEEALERLVELDVLSEALLFSLKRIVQPNPPG